MNTKYYFKAKELDLFNKISTPISVIITLGSPFYLWGFFPYEFIYIIMSVVFILIFYLSLFFSYAYSPKGFSIENRKVIIHKRISRFNSEIDLKEIDDVGLESQPFLTFRTFGVSGVWGYFGYFNGDDLWYITQLKNNVVLKKKLRKIIISPENPEEFISILKKLKELQND